MLASKNGISETLVTITTSVLTVLIAFIAWRIIEKRHKRAQRPIRVSTQSISFITSYSQLQSATASALIQNAFIYTRPVLTEAPSVELTVLDFDPLLATTNRRNVSQLENVVVTEGAAGFFHTAYNQ